MWLKPAVVAFFLNENYVVHSTDVDLAYSSKPVWESYLMYIHLAAGASAVDAAFQIEGDGSFPLHNSPLNSGNFVALPTEATKNLFSAWLALASEKMDTGGNQKGLEKLYEEDRYILCRTVQECQDAMKKRDEIAEEILNYATAPPQNLPFSFSPAEETSSTSRYSVPPTVIRTYTPPWWSKTYDKCALSGEYRLPEMYPCSSSFFYLHPVCTPKGSDRVGLKTRVLDKAGFWFIDSKYGCPVDDVDMKKLSVFYKGIQQQAFASGELFTGPQVEENGNLGLSKKKGRSLLSRRRLRHLFDDEDTLPLSPSSEEELSEFNKLVYLLFGGPSEEIVDAADASAAAPAPEIEVVEEEEDSGFDENEDLSKYSGQGRHGLERCVPLELRRPGTEARVARCPLQLAFA